MILQLSQDNFQSDWSLTAWMITENSHTSTQASRTRGCFQVIAEIESSSYLEDRDEVQVSWVNNNGHFYHNYTNVLFQSLEEKTIFPLWIFHKLLDTTFPWRGIKPLFCHCTSCYFILDSKQVFQFRIHHKHTFI